MPLLYRKSIRILSLFSLLLLAQCCCCFLPLRLQPPGNSQGTQAQILHVVQGDLLTAYRDGLYRSVIFMK